MSDITKTIFPATELSSRYISMVQLQEALEGVAGEGSTVQLRFDKAGQPEFVELFTPKSVDIDAAIDALVKVETPMEESDKVAEQIRRERMDQFSGDSLITKFEALERRVAALEQGAVKRG